MGVGQGAVGLRSVRWRRHVRPRDSIAVGGAVRIFERWPDEPWPGHLAAEGPNTAVMYGLSAYCSWIAGTYNTPIAGGAANIIAPGYISLGTGTATPQLSDVFGFAETYGTRQLITYTSVMATTGGVEADLILNYAVSAITGTFSEAMLLDAPTGSAAVGSGGATGGSTTLALASGAPAVTGGSAPGQYETIYINDGSASEYCAIASSAAAGASSWTLQQPLQHNHAANTPIVVFGGNLFAHSPITYTVASGTQPAVFWTIPLIATGS